MNSTNVRSGLNSLRRVTVCLCLAFSLNLHAQEDAEITAAPIVVRELAGIKTSDRMRLGSQVTICIRGLHRWIKEGNGNDPNSLRLVLDGRMLSSSEPTEISPPSQDYVNFVLRFNGANKEERAEWAAIFDAVRNAQDGRVLVAVGSSKSREAFASDVYARFELYPWFSFLALLLVLSLLLALVALARRTDLLRDTYGWPEAPRPSSPKPPFSLSRVQMAWWFYLVVAAYVYIWLVTQVPDIPTGSVLGLLGISATTGLAAVSLDKSKRSETEREVMSLETERNALAARIGDIRSRGQVGAALEQELQTRESRLAEVEAALSKQSSLLSPAGSTGFVDDILRDGSGISFHRFQMAVWSIVLGMVFIRAVYKDFSMPEFDPALLALMGVYSGTYVGFKFPEKPKG
jgi:hypothetical protein